MFSSVLMRIATIAADGIPSATARSLTSTLSTLALPLILIVVVVVMMVVSSSSNKKRQKQYESMLAEIKPGTRVRTIGGIYGTVTKVQDDVVIVSVGPDKARLVFTKQAIANIEDAPVEATIEGEIRETEKK